MISIFKKNFRRLSNRKSIIIMFILMIVAGISYTLYTNNRQDISINIAYVSDTYQKDFSENLNVTLVSETPKVSDLILNKYDAIVTSDLEVTTLKNEAFESQIRSLLKGESIPPKQDDLGLQIMKGIMMFLFLQSTFLLFVLGDDVEGNISDRILVSPLTSFRYLLGNIIFVVSVVVMISMSVLTIFKLFNIDIGYSLLKFLFTITLSAILSSSVSSVFYCIFKKVDTAAMFSQIFIILTSLLAGSFNLLEHQSGLLNSVSQILPQKLIFNFLAGDSVRITTLLYVMIWISTSWLISNTYLKKT